MTLSDDVTEPETAAAPAQASADDEVLRIAVSLQELKESLRASDMRIGVERALVRELDRIENRLKDAARARLHGAVDEVRLQLHLGLLDARERLELIAPFLRRILGRVERVKHDIKETAAPTAQLQVALARMELKDIVDDRRRRATEELRTIERATEHALDNVITRIDQLTTELRASS
jgi:hypothetical protein